MRSFEVTARVVIARVAQWLAVVALIVTTWAAVSPKASAAAAASPLRTFDVQALIETARPLYARSARGDGVLYSPSHRRYLLITLKGDVSKNGNWVEFISGELAAGGDVAPGAPSRARLFTSDYKTMPLLLRPPVWLNDDKTIAFLWCSGSAPCEVLALNLETGQTKRLAAVDTDITNFDITPDGHTLTFTAWRPNVSASDTRQAMVRDGFAVPMDGKLAYPLLEAMLPLLGDAPDPFHLDGENLYVATSEGSSWLVPIRLSTLVGLVPRISSDGRWVVLWGPPDPRHGDWSRFQGRLMDDYRRRAGDADQSKAYDSLVGQIWLVNVQRRTLAPIWDAPAIPIAQYVWSSDGEALLVGRTYAPNREKASTGDEFVVRDFRRDVTAVLPVGGSTSADIAIKPSENDPHGFELESGSSSETASWVKAGWRIAPTARAKRSVQRGAVALQQDINTPPTLVSISPEGRTRDILDLQPALSRTFSLGTAETIHWKDASGRAWSGRLYYPVGYDKARRYPLVMLVSPPHTLSPDEFSLSGNDIVYINVSVAQPLANRGMFALTVTDPDDPSLMKTGTPAEGPTILEGLEGAVKDLAARDKIDKDKVGLAGFSRTGYRVAYAITHASMPFAAASITDNVDESYGQYITLGAALVRGEAEAVNGGPPVGSGLSSWLRQAPGFNLDHVTAAVRFELDTGGVYGLVSHWEEFSILTSLHKPAEFFIVPDIEHSAHPPQRPVQQLASMSGVVDWMDFWLNDREDPSVAKADQFSRWRKLREMRNLQAKVGNVD